MNSVTTKIYALIFVNILLLSLWCIMIAVDIVYNESIYLILFSVLLLIVQTYTTYVTIICLLKYKARSFNLKENFK